MPQPNIHYPTAISSYFLFAAVKKRSISHFSILSRNSVSVALFTVVLSATILAGCSDLSAQIPKPVPSANTATQTQSLEKTQNKTHTVLNEQTPEQRSVWVTMANMRCH